MDHPLLKYVEGDMFCGLQEMKGKTILLPHVCNDKGAWGSGFVVPLARVFPPTKSAYLAWAKGIPRSSRITHYCPDAMFRMGRTQVVELVEQDPKIIVFNMVAQEMGGPRPLFYNRLAECMGHVLNDAKNNWKEPEIHAPMFGSNLAGGDWNFIEQLIYDCWLRDAKIPTTIYYLPGTLPSNWSLPAPKDA